MGSAFSTKTIYRFIAGLECAFAVVIAAFAVKCLVVFEQEDPADPLDPLKSSVQKEDGYDRGRRKYIQYAAILATVQAVIQIIAAVFLAIRSKFSNERNEEIHPGVVPKIWVCHSILQFLVQLIVFFVPTLLYEGMKNESDRVKSSVKEMYTYTLVSACFKGIFIWGVVSRFRSQECLCKAHDVETPADRSLTAS